MTKARLLGCIGSVSGVTVELDKPKIVLGRDPGACDVVLRQSFISKMHAAFETDDSGQTTVRDLESKYGTFVNGQPIDKCSLREGDRVGLGSADLVTFTYTTALHREDGVQPADERSPNSNSASSATGAFGDRATVEGLVTTQVSKNSVLTIGRAPDNQIVLNGSAVSRHHATLTVGATPTPVLTDIGSTNGTYVNGELLREPRTLSVEDIVFLGGFLLKVDGATVRQIDLSTSRILAVGLSREIKGEVILRDISFVALPGEFIGLMGPSGCGKTTLMDAIDGLQPAQTGTVFVGDLDLYRNFNSIRRSIGHVPQHDILHDDLTVEKTLLYSARLRFPETATTRELLAVVEDVLGIVNLSERRATPFRNLSGGQQKRLSIAIELLTKPNFLFLDEPTSPLDPETTEDLMDRFRRLADQGHIVVMVTHKFEKFRSMDKVAFLAEGGRLAFFGTPAAALDYFNCREPAEIFRRMHQNSPEQLARRFLSSPHFRAVEERIATSQSLISSQHSGGGAVAAAPVKTTLRSQVAQWWALTQRYFEIKLEDRRNTALLLLQSPIIAVILAVISGHAKNEVITLFVAAVIATWFGANNAIREIVAELPIYKRERRFSLRIPPYVLSKFAVLGAIGFVQSSIFVAVLVLFGLLDARDFVPILALFYLTALGSISVALFFSAIVSSSEKALSILPLLLIPQLLLSGFLKPIETFYVDGHGRVTQAAYDQYRSSSAVGRAGLGGVEKVAGLGAASVLSDVVLARWALEGLVDIVSINDHDARQVLARRLYVPAYSAVLDDDDSASIESAYHGRALINAFALAFFSLTFLPLTMWALKRKDVL